MNALDDTALPATAPAGVLRFWFGAHPLDEAAMQAMQPLWFRKSDEFDERIRARFAPAVAAALAGRLDGWAARPEGRLDGWAARPEGRLALLVLLDQFTRNIFRGQPQSFAGDARALAIALQGIELEHDQAVPPMARLFCYLPLEHAEDAALQARSVALFARLLNEAAPAQRAFFAGTLNFARQHQDVIARFGRFPHRNAALGRASTAQEAAWLAQPGAGF